MVYTMLSESLVNLILLFFAYAFLGWCIEVTLKYFQFHRFINRGFLTGPWLPIYGFGATMITITVEGLSPLESSVGTTFVISFVLCGMVLLPNRYCRPLLRHGLYLNRNDIY